MDTLPIELLQKIAYRARRLSTGGTVNIQKVNKTFRVLLCPIDIRQFTVADTHTIPNTKSDFALSLPDSVAYVKLTCSVDTVLALPESIVEAHISIEGRVDVERAKAFPNLTHLEINTSQYHKFMILDAITHLTLCLPDNFDIHVLPNTLTHLSVDVGSYHIMTRLPATLTHLKLASLAARHSESLPESLKYLITGVIKGSYDFKHLTFLLQLEVMSLVGAEIQYPNGLKRLIIHGKIRYSMPLQSLVYLNFHNSPGFPPDCFKSFTALKKLVLDHMYKFPLGTLPDSLEVLLLPDDYGRRHTFSRLPKMLTTSTFGLVLSHPLVDYPESMLKIYMSESFSIQCREVNKTVRDAMLDGLRTKYPCIDFVLA